MTKQNDRPASIAPQTLPRGHPEPDAELTLRQRAERIAQATAAQSPEAIATLSPEDLQRIVHELLVHQVELEMQNEELRRSQAEVEAARLRYFDLYDRAPVGYCTLSASGLIREVNLTAANLLGLARNALIGQPISRFILGEDRDAYYRFRRSLLASQTESAARSGPADEPRACALRMAKSSGAIVAVRLEAIAVADTDADGSLICRVAISDISSSKQAELDALNALMTAIPGVVYQFLMCPDGSWRFPYLSPGIESLYGLAAEAVYANPDALNLCLLPEDRPAHWASVEHAYQTLTPWCHEHRIRSYDRPDQLKWVRGQAIPFPQPDGSVLWNGILTDVTEEKRIELALRVSKQQLDMALHAAAMGIWDWEIAAGRVAWAAEHAALFGIALADFGGTLDDVQACVHPDDREQGMTVLRRTLEEGTDFDNIYRVVWPDGSIHWMHSLGKLFRDECGAPQRILGTTQDITKRKLADAALQRSQSLLAHTEAIARIGSWEWDVATDTVTWSDELFRLFQRDPAEGAPSFADHAQLYAPEDRQRLSDAVKAALAHGTPYELELRAIRKDGAQRILMAAGQVADTETRDMRLFGFVQDVTERRAAISAQRDSERQFRAMFMNAPLCILIHDADTGEMLDANPSACAQYGYDSLEALKANFDRMWLEPPYSIDDAMKWNEKTQQEGPQQFEWRYRRADGALRWVWMHLSTFVRHGEVCILAMSVDITHDKQIREELQASEARFEQLAHYDPLTMLPNRRLLADRLRQAMAQTPRRRQRLALAYLDLDGFKAINDRYGHAAGDQLLVALAHRMKQILREGDTLARLGGDEFVALLVDLEDCDDSVPLLNRLLAAAAAPVPLGDRVAQVSASVGVAFYPQPAVEVDADQLLRQADQAMYRAKLTGKNRYYVFDAEKDQRTREKHENLNRIRHALNAREFVLYYQPKVNLRSGEVIGVEALIRWQHPERGLLLPQDFLPMIEENSLAVTLGEWVIESVLTQMDRWRENGLDLPVSVNVCARQLQQVDFVARLGALLTAHPGVAPSRLALEILETSAMQDLVHVSKVVADCHKLGVSCILDDFGVGYSSLTYLKHLAVTVLKIDRNFVGDMLDNPDDLAIVESILGLAAAFRRQIIAEGVETLEQGERLLQLGCELAQGYGIAHPLPACELPGWIAAWRFAPRWRERPEAHLEV